MIVVSVSVSKGFCGE